MPDREPAFVDLAVPHELREVPRALPRQDRSLRGPLALALTVPAALIATVMVFVVSGPRALSSRIGASLLATVLWVAAVLVVRELVRFRKVTRFGAIAVGEIVSVARVQPTRSQTANRRILEVRFAYGGCPCTVVDELAEGEVRAEVGERVLVTFDPTNPKRAYVYGPVASAREGQQGGG